MHKTPLPEIPDHFRTENTLELYWEVVEYHNIYEDREYLLYLRRLENYTEPESVDFRWVDNPNKRWWNNEPDQIRESYVVPERKGTRITNLSIQSLGYKPGFTERDVYKAAEKSLENLENKRKADNLLGKYPPKTLDIDPATL